MMRKIFGGAMAFSMVGAVVLGGVLAWTNSSTFISSAQVGKLDFVALNAPIPDNRIGPDDGLFRPTDAVKLFNVGGVGGFDLLYNGGSVDILNVHVPTGGGDTTNCGTQNFEGRIQDLTAGHVFVSTEDLVNTIQEILDFPSAMVQVAVHAGAPVACQNDVVTYKVTLNMKTKPGN